MEETTNLLKDKKKVRNRVLKACKDYKYIYLLLVPGLLYYILFHYMPIYGVTLAFKDFVIPKGITGSPWVGLKHFSQLFSDTRFLSAIQNTIWISLGRLLFEFPIPIIIALLLNELVFEKFKKVVQSLMYFPYFISWVIMYSLLQNVFAIDGGLINGIIEFFGGEPINFLVNAKWFRFVIFSTDSWKTAGYSTILYVAAISNIDQQLYEAAYVDGANRFRRIWHITLPGIQFVILTVFILNVGNMMNGGFDQIVNIYNTAVYNVADIIDTYVFRQAMERGQFSLATAAGLFKSVINLTLLLTVDSFMRRFKGVGIYE